MSSARGRLMFSDRKWQPRSFLSPRRCQKRLERLRHPLGRKGKCNISANLCASHTARPPARLRRSEKMINYCFQGKHERDMKNARDRAKLSAPLPSHLLSRGWEKFLREIPSPLRLRNKQQDELLCNTERRKRRRRCAAENARVTAQNK